METPYNIDEKLMHITFHDECPLKSIARNKVQKRSAK